MSTKGQVVIPMELRQSLNLHPGDELVLERADSSLVLRKAGPKKSLADFLRECPHPFRVQRVKDAPKDLKL